MKNDTNRNAKKERVIMLLSSVFVLTALTVTGVYLKTQDTKKDDSGYRVDFSTLEKTKQTDYAQGKDTGLGGISQEIEDDLDYMPMEVGGSDIILPEMGKTQEKPIQETPIAKQEEEPELTEEVFVDTTLHFPGAGQILRPVTGEVLIPYSMDKSVYFTTLDQYKYNPAQIYQAETGTVVAVCADGLVEDISYDPVTGYTVLLDMGDGYKAVYGQMDAISYIVGDVAYKGTALGEVAEPTKYFAAEGSNLYFELQYNGEPLDPELYFMK